MAQDRSVSVPGWRGRQLQQAKLDLEARRRRLRAAADASTVSPTSGATPADRCEVLQ